MKYQKSLGAVLCAASLSLACLLSGCGVSFCGMPLGGKEEIIFTCAEEPDAGPVPEEDTGTEPDAGTELQDGNAAPENGMIDLNSATMEELMTLNGVGESRAKAIMEYRDQNPFTKIEDIMQIPGIKEGIFSKIKDQITVR